MNAHVCKLVVILIILLAKAECELPSSKVCEVYDPSCKSHNCPKQMECPVVKHFKVSHCFAVISDTPLGQQVIRKGCWLQNLQLCPLSNQCKMRKTSRHTLRFCCCTGDNCNSKIN